VLLVRDGAGRDAVLSIQILGDRSARDLSERIGTWSPVVRDLLAGMRASAGENRAAARRQRSVAKWIEQNPPPAAADDGTWSRALVSVDPDAARLLLGLVYLGGRRKQLRALEALRVLGWETRSRSARGRNEYCVCEPGTDTWFAVSPRRYLRQVPPPTKETSEAVGLGKAHERKLSPRSASMIAGGAFLVAELIAMRLPLALGIPVALVALFAFGAYRMSQRCRSCGASLATTPIDILGTSIEIHTPFAPSRCGRCSQPTDLA
jgi:hypothetical protein